MQPEASLMRYKAISFATMFEMVHYAEVIATTDELLYSSLYRTVMGARDPPK